MRNPLCASITPPGFRVFVSVFAAGLALTAASYAGDGVDAATAVLSPNQADEPVAEAFSMDAAVGFLDHAAVTWTRDRKCFTCHTNFLYLMAKPVVAANDPAHAEVRSALESLVLERWLDVGPRWDAEVVMAAATLAVDDRLTTGTLADVTREALDRMWTLQREDGGTNWLKCGWPPMESDDDYGVAVLALAAGAAPDDYQRTATARAGLDRIRRYLAANPPPTLHHEAMLVWADSYLEEDLLSDEDREKTIDALLALQKDDVCSAPQRHRR
jgi:squalene-hopene/tetraprenyl-beta-curcumene cyclase